MGVWWCNNTPYKTREKMSKVMFKMIGSIEFITDSMNALPRFIFRHLKQC